MGRTSETTSSGISRRHFLRQSGLGVARLTAASLALPEALAACGGGSTTSGGTAQALNVSFIANVSPMQSLQTLFNGYKQKYGTKVNYLPEPAVFSDIVEKFTTYLSSSYTGLDVIWIDDFMTATFSNANWLAPLEHAVSADYFSAVTPAQLKLSTYNGHTYRVPANFGTVMFYYRKDLFDKAGLSVPTTWDEIVSAGQKLTKDGVYGIGLAGRSGSGELFNEMSYWMGQAGASPLQMNTPGSRQALQFVYDLIHRYKIAPPDTVTAGYTPLLTSFQNGKLAMWVSWDAFYSSFKTAPSFANSTYQLGVAHPPKGPADNGTIIANWGWAISKYSKNQDAAAKFIEYATSMSSELTLAQTGQTPSRTDALAAPSLSKSLPQASFLSDYVQNVPLHYRPITPHAQRVSDAFEGVVNKYLNNQLDLESTISQAQQAIDQAQQS